MTRLILGPASTTTPTMPCGEVTAIPFCTPCADPLSIVIKLFCRVIVFPITCAGRKVYFLILPTESRRVLSVVTSWVEAVSI